ncbi:MAG: molybdate ABC transporter substrate-binding protein [Alphaproteobacteria bacterium]
MRAFTLLALALTLSCPPTTAGAAERILVFAAASTVEALGASVALYRKTADDDIRLSFAATSALARQIEHGAPADLFLAANTAWMDRLETRKLIVPGSRTPLFGNRLVLIAPRASGLTARLDRKFDLTTLLGPGDRLSIADPDHVPAGAYAKAALEKLGMWQRVSSRLARTPNVRAALALVARGEAVVGIVYGTDAMASRAVRVLDLFPTTSHAPIRYPLAIVAGRDRPGVRALYRFLLSPEAASSHAGFGFMVAQP